MKYMLGANYWGRKWGTEMWAHYDPEDIRVDMKKLSEWGVRCLRVFPNWRDFQPVDKAYAWAGTFGEYVNSHTGAPVYDDGVDEGQIEYFRDFCRAAEENGINLVVSVVTGWMSGRIFCPPALNGKNLLTDPEALMWMRRYIHRFVRELKDEKSIILWDIGNECNCLGKVNNGYEAYLWTATVVDAIRSEDKTRGISSGMHALSSGDDASWQIAHQGELCDIMTTHPYPSPTVGGDIEPYTRLRMSFLPTAQSIYYSGVANRPAYIQESGVFSETIGNRNMAADFMRIQILSSFANGLCGYQWWCAWEQKHLEFPPYTWAMIERELGLFDKNDEPKPVAYVMRDMSRVLDKLPNPFPKRIIDGVCVLSRGQNQQNVAIAAQIFSKQAGFDLDVVYTEDGRLPDCNLYFMPAISGWQVIYKKTWDKVLEKVKNGATLYISYAGGQITDFSELLGAESMGVMANTKHNFILSGSKMDYCGKEILLAPASAEVIAENESGNPVVIRNKYGKGEIFFVNFSPETIAFDTPDGFNTCDYYKIYSTVAKEVILKKSVIADDPNLAVTINPEDNGNCFVTVLNYCDKEVAANIKVKDGYIVKEVLYGNMKKIPACDGVIFRVGV